VRQGGKSGFNVTRANITANQTDYAPTAAGTYILTPDANRNISGFAGGVDGRRIRIINGAAIGSGFVLTLVIGAGSAGNQVTDHTAGNIALNPQAGVDLDYDGTNTVWVGGPR
jgi:hypothetical protein